VDILVILFIAVGSVFSLLILLGYAPVHKKTFGIHWSPKLFVAKLIAPFDVGITLFLVMGTILGLTMVTGIGNIIFNIATGLGISAGSVLIRKVFVPHWKRQFKEIKEDNK